MRLSKQKEFYPRRNAKHKNIMSAITPKSNQSFIDWNKSHPLQDGKEITLYPYELDLFNKLETRKHIWVKKATGLGITELILRYIAWRCENDNSMKSVDVSVVVVTGPRLELAQQLIERLKNIVKQKNETKNTICMINGCKIEAFPSHHLAAARGLNPKIVFLDEADYFPVGQQEEARAVSERYIGKSNPHIIFVSTPNLPGGLFDTMERENDGMYEMILLHYSLGMKTIYRDEDIEKAKLSPSFPREYELKYGYGIGNIFTNINECIEKYDLELKGNNSVLAVDPAYGSSKFGIMGMEKRDDGIIYVTECMQLERPSPSAMTELLVNKSKLYPTTIIDSAHPGLIRDLQERGVNASPIQFGFLDTNKQSLASIMTMEAAQSTRERRVRLHPGFRDLILQLEAATYNEKGGVDKTQFNFDLGDCLLMGVNFLKDNTPFLIEI